MSAGSLYLLSTHLHMGTSVSSSLILHAPLSKSLLHSNSYSVYTGEKQYKFEEILPIYQGLKHTDEGTFKEFKEAFKSYDREGQGFMSAMELRNVLTYMGMVICNANSANYVYKQTENSI